MGLSDALFVAEEGIRLVRTANDAAEALPQADVEAVLAALDHSFPIETRRGIHEIRSVDGQTGIATLRIGRARISLRGLDLPQLDGITVERRDLPLGEDPDAISLARYIDREDLFTILFSDLTLAYIEGALFRDEALAGGGEAFLARLHVEPSLADVNSEKGDFTADQTAFSADSVFRSVVDVIANDDVLLCDDLGDEWADFIGVSTTSNPTMISFYHAKHGQASLSADSVGQAIKNLGRMNLPSDMLPHKLVGWDDNYRNNGVQTQIGRMIRGGTPAEIASKLGAVRSAPDVLHRVFIVTSSLGRAQVKDVFDAAAEGTSPSPHFVQLYWLLMSYFSACAEMGVRGYVVCRP